MDYKGRMKEKNPYIIKLINKFGTQEAVAKHFNVCQETVSYWLNTSVPADKAILISRILKVKLEKLVPHLYEVRNK